MNIAQKRKQLELATMFAKVGIDFVVVPVTTEAEQIELAERALRKIDELKAAREIEE